MSVHYTLATMKMVLPEGSTEYVGELHPIPDALYTELGVEPLSLHYSRALPEVFGIPDSSEGMFMPPNEAQYFMACLQRLAHAPRCATTYYLSDMFYDEVRNFIQVWMAVQLRLSVPRIYIVWS